MSALALDQGVVGTRFNAHQIFGLLLFREQGKTVGEISKLVDLPAEFLFEAMSSAERGEFARAPAFLGTTLKLGSQRSSAKNVTANGAVDEIFLPRWQRAVLRKLCSNGGEISVSAAHAIRGGYPETSDAGMEPLHRSLRIHRMAWSLVQRDGQVFYQMDEPTLEKLQALISNRWKLPA